MMRPNEFILTVENEKKLCYATAVLYSDETNRGFVVYDDGEIKDSKKVLKIGEIFVENDEVYVESLIDKEEINDVWQQFKKIYNDGINQ